MSIRSVLGALADGLLTLGTKLKSVAGTSQEALIENIQKVLRNNSIENVSIDSTTFRKFDEFDVNGGTSWENMFDGWKASSDFTSVDSTQKLNKLMTAYLATGRKMGGKLSQKQLESFTDAFRTLETKPTNLDIKPNADFDDTLKALKNNFLNKEQIDARNIAEFNDLFVHVSPSPTQISERVAQLKQLQAYYKLQEQIGPILVKDYANQIDDVIEKSLDVDRAKFLLNHSIQGDIDPAYTKVFRTLDDTVTDAITSDARLVKSILKNNTKFIENDTLLDAMINALGDSNVSKVVQDGINAQFEAVQKTIPMVKEMSKNVWNAVPVSTWNSIKECGKGKGPKACLAAFAKLVGVLVTIATPIALGKCYGGDGKGRDGKVFGDCQDGAYDDCKYHCFDKYKDGFDDTDTTYPRKNWSFVVDEERDATFAPSNALWKEAMMTPIPPRDEDLGRFLSMWEHNENIEKSRELYCTVNNLQTWRAKNYRDREDKDCTDYCKDVCGKEFPATQFFDKLGESLEDLTKPVADVGEAVVKITVGTTGKITGAAGKGLFDGLGWFAVALVVGLIAFFLFKRL